MNYTTIAGHLGADPETRFTSNGKKVTTLRVACKARKDETIWWKVTIWGDQFDKMLTFFKKGSSIIVMGEIAKPEIFNDRDGKPQVSMQIVAHHIAFSPFGRTGKPEEGAGVATGSGFATQGFNVGGGQGGGGNDYDSFSHAGSMHNDKEFSDDEIPF